MKFLQNLKQYCWAIIFLILISINSYSIKRNADSIESNASAVIVLSKGAEILSDTVKDIIHVYKHDRTKLKENIALTEICLDQVVKNKVQIKKSFEYSYKVLKLLNSKIDAIHRKPTYKYLKSVTVFIIGEIANLPKNEQSEENNNESFQEKKISGWCGTGVIVKMDDTGTYILTNKHVAGGYQTNPVKIFIWHDGKKRHCQIVKLHDSQDLALLKISERLKNKQVVKGIAYPEITEKVYTVGHSLGRPFLYEEGIYSGTSFFYDIYQLPCIGGQSGSGIFNKDGLILGLICSNMGIEIQGKISWDYTRTNAVKGVYIVKFLKELL